MGAAATAAADELPWQQNLVEALHLAQAGAPEPSRLLTALLATAGVSGRYERHRARAEARLMGVEALHGINATCVLL